MRVYAQDIDNLRLPAPAGFGDPKGMVDKNALRAAAWGTDFDPGSRNSITQALTQQPAAQQPIGGGGVGPPATGVGAAGGGGVFGAVSPLDHSVPGTANYIPGSTSPYPPKNNDWPTGVYVPPGMEGVPWSQVLASNPDLAQMNWGGGYGSAGMGADWQSGGASGSAAGTGATGGDTG
jgi:hypothetical protein